MEQLGKISESFASTVVHQSLDTSKRGKLREIQGANHSDTSNRIGLERSMSRNRDEIPLPSTGEAVVQGAVQRLLAYSQAKMKEMGLGVVNLATTNEFRVTSSEALGRNDSKGVRDENISKDLTGNSDVAHLLKIDQQSEVRVLPDRRIEINGQLKLLPGKLAEIKRKDRNDLKTMLELTRQLSQPDGNRAKCEEGLNKISKRYYIQFEYNRQRVREYLKLLKIEHLNIFQKMTGTEEDRILNAMVLAELKWQGPGEPADLQFQAVHYARLHDVSSVYQFIGYYEFYLEYAYQELAKMEKELDEEVEKEMGEWKRKNGNVSNEQKVYEAKRNSLMVEKQKKMGLDSTKQDNIICRMIRKVFHDTLKSGEQLVASEETQPADLENVDEYLDEFFLNIANLTNSKRKNQQKTQEEILNEEREIFSEKLKGFMENKNILLPEGWKENFGEKWVEIRRKYNEGLETKIEDWRRENWKLYRDDNAYQSAERINRFSLAAELQEEMGLVNTKPKKTFKKLLRKKLFHEMGKDEDLRVPNEQTLCAVDKHLELLTKCWEPLMKQSKVSLPLKEGESMQMLTQEDHEEIVRRIQELARKDNLSFPTAEQAAYHTIKHVDKISKDRIGHVSNDMSNFAVKRGYRISKAIKGAYKDNASHILIYLQEQIMQEFNNQDTSQDKGQEWDLARDQMKRSLWLCLSDLANEWQVRSITHSEVEQRLRACLSDLANKWQEQSDVENQVERYQMRIKSIIVTPKQEEVAAIAAAYRFGQHDEHIDYNFRLGEQFHKTVVRVHPDGQVTVRTCF